MLTSMELLSGVRIKSVEDRNIDVVMLETYVISALYREDMQTLESITVSVVCFIASKIVLIFQVELDGSA